MSDPAGRGVTDVLDAAITGSSYMLSFGPLAFLDVFARILGL